MIATWTHEGTVIVFDKDIGTVSARSEHAAWREVDRRKAMKRDRENLEARDMILAYPMQVALW